MPLRGSLKDFGIADIFQLVGHQAKSGSLSVRSRDHHVVVYFRSGNFLRAESSTRDKRDLLGSMLTRAEVITDEQLVEALALQKQSLKRLGDVLIDTGTVAKDVLREFTRLQTTETIYRLFLWDGGSYEFHQAEVEETEDDVPLRTETVLMEGFRQLDTWPIIRRYIAGYGIVFERREDLDALLAKSGSEASPAGDDDPFGDLDEAFGELEDGDGTSVKARLKNVGPNERLIYGLIGPGRDVQKVIDLSRLGEFEACCALVHLAEADVIGLPLAAATGRRPSAVATVGGITKSSNPRWFGLAVRGGLLVLAVLVVVVGLERFGIQAARFFSQVRDDGYHTMALERLLSRGREGYLREALDTYRALHDRYPERLEALVEVGLVRENDLVFPWGKRFVYQGDESRYTLLPPMPVRATGGGPP